MADLLKTTTAAPAVPTTLKNRHIEEKAKLLMLAILEESRDFLSRTKEPPKSDNWRDLVQLVRQPVLHILKYALGIVDTEDQRDMFQRVMLRLYRYHLSYDSSRPFMPWLYAIARNVKAEWMALLAKWPDTDADPEPVAPQTSDNLTAKLVVKELFAQLPEEDGQILWLFYYEGLKEAEISASLNIPLSATKFRLRRARKHAREILTAHPQRQANEASK